MFAVHLEPGASWQARAHILLQSDARVHQPKQATQERAGSLHERWLKVCTDVSTSNQELSQSYRLPEVFAGPGREPELFPVQYRGANIPQAWGRAASSTSSKRCPDCAPTRPTGGCG